MSDYDFTLLDDGTLDTVVEVECCHCHETWEERFSQEYASEFRDEAGELDEESFWDDIEDTIEHECKPEPYLHVSIDGEEEIWVEDLESVRISNPDKENGYDETHGPIDWMNSAAIRLDRDDDAVHLTISVGDPRGAFVFTVRRRPDTGELLMHLPTPDQGMLHERLTEIHPGTYKIGHYHN